MKEKKIFPSIRTYPNIVPKHVVKVGKANVHFVKKLKGICKQLNKQKMKQIIGAMLFPFLTFKNLSPVLLILKVSQIGALLLTNRQQFYMISEGSIIKSFPSLLFLVNHSMEMNPSTGIL